MKDFLEKPVLDDESWIPLCQIDDTDADVKITIIFATNKTLENLKFSETSHCDATNATYRLSLSVESQMRQESFSQALLFVKS